jgi:hypothetical protein
VLATQPGLRDLRTEANHLHRALFGRDAPAEVQDQYARALQTAPLAEVPRCDLTALIERGVDLEALELALRRRARVNALTQRFQVLCYLAEARPEYYSRFVNEPPRFLVGWLTLGLHTARSVYKLIKGQWLLRIHDVR